MIKERGVLQVAVKVSIGSNPPTSARTNFFVEEEKKAKSSIQAVDKEITRLLDKFPEIIDSEGDVAQQQESIPKGDPSSADHT
jgi:hypothetical protein